MKALSLPVQTVDFFGLRKVDSHQPYCPQTANYFGLSEVDIRQPAALYGNSPSAGRQRALVGRGIYPAGHAGADGKTGGA